MRAQKDLHSSSSFQDKNLDTMKDTFTLGIRRDIS